MNEINQEIIIAQHPCGSEINKKSLIIQFRGIVSWEDICRQLIVLSRQLPPLNENLKQQQVALTGCENRVWLGHQQMKNGAVHFYADSDGRIIRGLLVILLTAIEGLLPKQLLTQNLLILFDTLNIFQQLSTDHKTSLYELSNAVKNVAKHYAHCEFC